MLGSAAAHARAAAPFLPCFVAFHDYVGSLAAVAGRSGQPTFNTRASDGGADAAGAPRTVVALSKLSVRWNWHGRGDVVVLRSPSDPAELITKRLIALAGDWVQRRAGAREVPQVPRGHVWVEGDNARFSKDSNAFGAVPAGLIESQVVATLWPPAEAGRVARVEPPRERVIEGRRPFIRAPRF